MFNFEPGDISDDEFDRRRDLYEPFTQAVRELVDATIRTEVDEATVRSVQADIEAATARLREKQLDGPFGVRVSASGRGMQWGNAVVGLRNPIAPPLTLVHDEAGRAWAEFDLGAAYEGPPGLVHGGVSAMILDHILGATAAHGRGVNFTGTIEVKYLRGTPLGPLRSDAWIERIDRFKTFACGTISDSAGVTVEANGVFIVPKWARKTDE